MSLPVAVLRVTAVAPITDTEESRNELDELIDLDAAVVVSINVNDRQTLPIHAFRHLLAQLQQTVELFNVVEREE